jgi:predicted DNA-binding antitoxin AbrB/MazE fold protein
MGQLVQAVYEHGHLRLLDPINLTEGEKIQIMILSERERARAILGDLLVEYAPESNDDIDEEALQAEIDAEMQGKPPVSDIIIEERREGP